MDLEAPQSVSDSSTTKVTSECPPPPFYWTLGDDPSILKPPVLSQDVSELTQSIDTEYGGVIRNMKRKRQFDTSIDYKTLLKSLMQTLVKKAIAIASNVPATGSNNIGSGASAAQEHDALLQLQNVLVELHGTLGEYRTHEARETIILAITKELGRLQELESSISIIYEQTAES